MNTFTEWGAEFFQWVLRTSWQAAVLVLLILLVQWLFRKRLSPAWRYGLWLLLVVRLLMPVSPRSALSVFNLLHSTPSGSSEDAASRASLASPGSESHERSIGGLTDDAMAQERLVAGGTPDRAADSGEARQPSRLVAGTPHPAPAAAESGREFDWERGALWLWLGVLGVLGIRLGCANLRFLSSIRRSGRVTDPMIQRLLEDCQREIGFRQPVTLVETPDVLTPAVYGLGRKWLLLPKETALRFSKDELRYIFLHELAHLRRRDVEVNWLLAGLQLLHWFNPIVWFAFRRMRADRELATDALVLDCAGSEQREQYGQTIIRLLEEVSRPVMVSGTVGVAESKQQVFERIRMIRRFRPRRAFSALAGLLMLSLGVLGLTSEVKPNQENAGAVTGSSGKALVLRVVRAEDEQPIEEGRAHMLLFRAFSADGIVQTNLSFQHGRLELELGTKAAALILAVIADGRVPKVLSWRPQQGDPIPSAYTLKLDRGITIGGLVQDEQGRPIHGVRVQMSHPGLSDYAEKATPRERMALGWEDVHTETTDAEGRWSCNHYPKGYEDIAFSFSHPDYLQASASLPNTMFDCDIELSMADLEARNATLVLRKGRSVTGRIVDSHGRGIAGATVALGEFFASSLKTVTDSEGRFNIANSPDGEQKLTVRAKGYAPERLAIQVSSNLQPREIALAKGGVLRGVVKDPDGAPISGVMVALEEWRGHNSIEWRVDTDAEGRFSWDSAPLDPAEYFFGRRGYTWIRNRALTADGSLHEITLNPAMRVTGNVLDAQTRQPIRSFKVVPGYDGTRWYGGSTVQGKNGSYEIELEEPAREYAVRIEAEGYAFTVSPWYQPNSGNHVFNAELEKGGRISGVVLLPDGRPASDAQVALCLASSGLSIGRGRLSGSGPGEFVKTDPSGQFQLNQNPKAHSVVAIHAAGYREIPLKNMPEDGAIRLQPFGRIEGTVILRGRPAAGEKVCLLNLFFNPYKQGPSLEWNAFSAVADAEGEFTIDKIPPGEYAAYLWPKEMGTPFSHKTVVHVRPGTTVTVAIRSRGRPVVGRATIKNLEGKIDWRTQARELNRISTKYEAPETPQFKTREEYKAWLDSYYESENYRNMQRESRSYSLSFDADGGFRADDVPPGIYDLTITVREPSLDQFHIGKQIGSIKKEIEVPAFDGEWTDEPYDAGLFEITLRQSLRVGQPAPAFEVKTLDGATLALSDLRGKFVLLDFWATWCGPCVAEQPHLKATWDAFGKDPRFVMVGLSLDRNLDALTAFIKKESVPWTQAWLGKWEDTQLPSEYGVYGIPSIILIDPEGRIAAVDLRGDAIKAAVEKAVSAH